MFLWVNGRECEFGTRTITTHKYHFVTQSIGNQSLNLIGEV